MPTLTRLIPFVALAAILPAISSCGSLGGGDPNRLEMSDFYNLYLPVVRSVVHPDSSSADDDASLNQIRFNWSVNHSQRFGSREYSPGNYTSFATLWSRDLADATLRREISGDLSPDLQERMQQEQTERYENSIIVDVHLFVPAVRGYDLSETSVRGAGSNVELEVNGRETYRASTIESSLVDQYQMGPSDVPVFHRLNRIYFPRTVDGRDVLADVERLRLIVRMTRGGTTELWFTWRVQQ